MAFLNENPSGSTYPLQKIRPYDQGLWNPLVSLNKGLLNPYFWGGVGYRGAWSWLAIFIIFLDHFFRWTMVFSVCFLGERLNPIHVLAVIFTMAGPTGAVHDGSWRVTDDDDDDSKGCFTTSLEHTPGNFPLPN